MEETLTCSNKKSSSRRSNLSLFISVVVSRVPHHVKCFLLSVSNGEWWAINYHTSSLNFISDFHCFHRNSRFLFSNFERWVRYSRNFLISRFFLCNDALFLFVSAVSSSTVRPSSEETIKQRKIGETRSLAFFTPVAPQVGLFLIIHDD